LLPADDQPERVGLALQDNVHVHVPLGHFRGKQEVVFFAVRRIAADVDDLSVDADFFHRFGEDELGDLLGHQIHVLHNASGQPHAVGEGGLARVRARNGSPASTVPAARSERMKGTDFFTVSCLG
jgi:hypothetical protein